MLNLWRQHLGTEPENLHSKQCAGLFWCIQTFGNHGKKSNECRQKWFAQGHVAKESFSMAIGSRTEEITPFLNEPFPRARAVLVLFALSSWSWGKHLVEAGPSWYFTSLRWPRLAKEASIHLNRTSRSPFFSGVCTRTHSFLIAKLVRYEPGSSQPLSF